MQLEASKFEPFEEIIIDVCRNFPLRAGAVPSRSIILAMYVR